MKVVYLDKLHNFYIGRIWSVFVKFGERDKSSIVDMDVKGVLDRCLTKFWSSFDQCWSLGFVG
jgi:hypothetical protein